MKLPEKVIVKEVGPRDGLQNEKTVVATEDKIAWINSLSETGLTYIEASSFVHPKWIPQLADAGTVLEKIKRKPGVTYAALVPNMRGLERALKSDVDEVSVFLSASEAHNLRNINKSIAETYPVLEKVVKEAKSAGKTVRGYISTVIACPYAGPVSPKQVREVADRLFAMGVDEVSLGDTIGASVPADVDRLLDELLPHFDAGKLAMHFHDTRGTALANVVKSLEMGITVFDSAAGGLGGCPYAKGASGNAATEDLLYLFHQMGIKTGIDFHKTLEAAKQIEGVLGKPLKSKQMEIYRSEGGA
ncbi:hydroxymethylglutaryl-CoA lyase YngG [Weizmannia acidilactici]|uniref:Hydroxymethylglutaryl-CoA lyase YngG n=1 Tax=Weizmannia acidilactici TaxID=2607726 RepID=A0A5J4JGF2_9BACI|nr:hydroxymethylglutaryl-CoA lyase [Weizmannia acidilactici]GER68030.1 hydroxymethylglutaryl-CoA lyase YngG [Weizmannia acidilactici]GER70771.1 hydroxymethylglutaryl-CoA lyase YngG [Weizmannia acidilactici]GER74335.1 hydroxymethylglutaryl-CoA lyase YngG [Weizmannia acidilactici]